jgi:hypothetical protein
MGELCRLSASAREPPANILRASGGNRVLGTDARLVVKLVDDVAVRPQRVLKSGSPKPSSLGTPLLLLGGLD